MDDIAFNNQNLSVIDEWLQVAQKDNLVATLSDRKFIDDGRIGLGKKSKTSGDQKDALSTRLEKSARVKEKKKKSMDDDEDIGELHGVVELEEESKLNSSKRKKFNNYPTKPSNESKSNQKIVNNTSKQENNNTSKEDLGVSTVVSSNNNTKQTNQKNEHNSTSSSKKPTNQPNKMNIAGELNKVTSPLTENVPNIINDNNVNVVRKKHKTRSKQKNIRRDNRSNELKPKHLQYGSEEYEGRTLTQETRKILGIS